MSWLTIAILAYLILAGASMADKYLLTARIPDPKVYAFYSGFFSTLIVVIIPFIDFQIPSPFFIFLSLVSGASFFIALFYFYKTLKSFEVSRVVPAIGALIPLFSLILAYISSRGEATLKSVEIPAFLFLIIGSFMINYERKKSISLKSLASSTITSFFFSFHFIVAKHVYMVYPFWTTMIWVSVGGFIMAMIFFILFEDIRREIFVNRVTFQKRTASFFLLSKVAAGAGGLLQNWAIFLAPSVATVAIINGLQGSQYAFLLIMTVFLSIKFPCIIKEEISKRIIFQKTLSIFLIMAGMALLAFFNYK